MFGEIKSEVSRDLIVGQRARRPRAAAQALSSRMRLRVVLLLMLALARVGRALNMLRTVPPLFPRASRVLMAGGTGLEKMTMDTVRQKN